MFPAELFYRSCYPKLYLWPDQLRYNSLAEQTYEKYGNGIFGKTIYIIGNSYEMSDFTARTFFKVFDPKMKAEGTKVEFIDSIRDIGMVDDQMLVLREYPSAENYELHAGNHCLPAGRNESNFSHQQSQSGCPGMAEPSS